MTRGRSAYVATLFLCALSALACRRESKPVPRTEPWPAPGVGSTGNAAAAQRLTYEVVRGSASVEFGTRRQPLRATISRIEGTIEWDRLRSERSRALLRADLLSLSVTASRDGGEDSTWTARAFDALELGALRPSEERERDRWAELRLISLEPPPAAAAELARGRATTSAQAELTLHHFRVPLSLQVEIAAKESDGGPPALVIRTSRSFVVPLSSHDIVPRSADGTLAPSPAPAWVSEVGREARVSVELFAESRGAPAPAITKP